jgi:arylsulfatase
VDHLIKRNILDNTLIMFFSDNGCSGETGRFGMHWDEYKIDNYSEWRKKSGWSISQGECWASYSNTPLRKYKMFEHEGGIATPFIAHWPSGIKNIGRIFDKQIFHISDIMATVCEAAGVSYPDSYNGSKIKPTPGLSMLSFIKEEKGNMEPRTLYWQHQTCAALREGDWKIVTVDDRDETKWELYNLAKDRSETENLINKHPDIAERLIEKWFKWAQESNVMPYPEERGNLKKVPWPPRAWPQG